MKALSIRQPWAWLIVNGYKPVENRTWRTRFVGRVFVQSGKTMTKADYEACRIFIDGFTNIELPGFDYLRPECGGIVGETRVFGCVEELDSPWFTGPFGFLLRDSRPLPFTPCRGALGFYSPEPLGDLGATSSFILHPS